MADKKATRVGWGEGLAKLGEKYGDVVVVDADLCGSVGSKDFSKLFPERHFDVGIAEQNGVGVAAGLARDGFVPFFHSFAVFAAGRAFEIIRNAVCYSNINVKIVGSHSGITPAADGGTHEAIEDIAIMRALPNMTVLVPCDYNQAKAMAEPVYKHQGPVYVRTSREAMPVCTNENDPFEIGKVQVLRGGSDVCIFACGIMVAMALDAAAELAKDGIEARVVNVHTIKPFDAEGVVSCAKECGGRVVVCEEASSIGGLGDAVSAALVGTDGISLRHISVGDRFGQSGSCAALLEYYGLTPKHIIEEARSLQET